MSGQSIRVRLVIIAAIECVAVAEWVVRLVELIVRVRVDNTTIAVVGVKQVVDSGQYPADIIEEIFKLSDVDGEKFLECKAHPIQKEKVNFEIDPEKGVRFFDPFNFFTRGIYKDMDGLTVWTTDNLKEPWKYDEEE